MNVVLTMSTDGVTFKRISKSQAWPLYLRLEGLPHKEKNSYGNMLMPSFALDGLGLYADDLLKPASELMKKPTIWWTNLGKDDKERGKTFDILSQTRMEWAVFAREALGRALGDVRAYEFNPVRTKLCFPKKKRVIETTRDSSFPTKEIEKTNRKHLALCSTLVH